MADPRPAEVVPIISPEAQIEAGGTPPNPPAVVASGGEVVVEPTGTVRVKRRRSWAAVGLFVLAVFYTLYFARAFFLPIMLAVLLDMLLSPIVRALKRARVPELAGAAIVILGLLAAVGVTTYSMLDPARHWIAQVPQTITAVQGKLRKIREPVEQVARTAERVEEATNVRPDTTQSVTIKGPSLGTQLLGTTQDLIIGAVEVIALLYFLLASGDLFLQKIVRIVPQLKDKKRAVMIARDTQEHVSRYLLTISTINATFGLTVGLAMHLLGMPNAVLWGCLAFLFEYVPYLGGIAMVALLSMVGAVTYDSLRQAIAAPLTYLVLNAVLENMVSPYILGRSLRLNPVAILIGVVFWFWLWGVPGAFIAVPSLVTVKIFCDHIDNLRPLGEFLGK